MSYYDKMNIVKTPSGKVLDKNASTSILCENKLLIDSSELSLICGNNENKYYNVIDTNIVIMHVEHDFCILVDNYVDIYNSTDKVSLPKMLSALKYGVYQVKGDKTYRDWVRCTKSSRAIGHDIQDIVHGNGAIAARKNGLTLDHGAETCNELLTNCMYKQRNINNGSHRVCIRICTVDDLRNIIQKIREYEENGSTGFFLKE